MLTPSKVLGIGRNYHAHAKEMGGEAPPAPLVFLKPSSAIISSGDAIIRPRGYQRVDFEGELGVVIGAACRSVRAADALEYVRGYVCVNDVTVRDLQKTDGQWARAKGFDTFCPVGPEVVAGLDPSSLQIVTRLNGEVRQDSTTANMIHSVAEIIEHISACMTLREGDLIATGTPAGVGNLVAGDVVEVEIEGIGILSNPVVDAEV